MNNKKMHPASVEQNFFSYPQQPPTRSTPWSVVIWSTCWGNFNQIEDNTRSKLSHSRLNKWGVQVTPPPQLTKTFNKQSQMIFVRRIYNSSLNPTEHRVETRTTRVQLRNGSHPTIKYNIRSRVRQKRSSNDSGTNSTERTRRTALYIAPQYY